MELFSQSDIFTLGNHNMNERRNGKPCPCLLSNEYQGLFPWD